MCGLFKHDNSEDGDIDWWDHTDLVNPDEIPDADSDDETHSLHDRTIVGVSQTRMGFVIHCEDGTTLPEVTISEELLDVQLECPVCGDLYDFPGELPEEYYFAENIAEKVCKSADDSAKVYVHETSSRTERLRAFLGRLLP